MKNKIITGIVVVIVLLFGLISISGDSKEAFKAGRDAGTKVEEPTKQPDPTPTRKEEIEKQFSGWDGSHFELTEYIKDNMNNPKSYEHVETVYVDNDDFLIVATKFRGENAFGGTVINTVRAKVDLNGNILEILE